MLVGLAEEHRLWHLLAAGEDLGADAVLEGPHDQADLARVHDRPVELLALVDELVVELAQLDRARLLVSHPDPLAGSDLSTLLGDLGADSVELLVDVDPVEDRLLLGVLRHDVVVEVGGRRRRGRRREPDDERVEVVEHLTPAAVDRAVALVGPDDVEHLDRNRRLVGDLDRPPSVTELEGRALVEVGVVLLLTAQHRVQALDR